MSLPDSSLAIYVDDLEEKRLSQTGTVLQDVGACDSQLSDNGAYMSANDSESALSTETIAHCRQLMQWLLMTEASNDDVEPFMQLLEVKPVKQWGAVVAELHRCSPTSIAPVAPALNLLRGWLSLFEVLCMMGPDWAPSAKQLQGLAQRCLFKLCTGTIVSSTISVGGLLRCGATLMRTDRRGRTAAHLAAQSNLDLLGTIVRAAPATLIMQDIEGFTPLEMLADAEGQPGDSVGALVDAALHCLAALPQHTALVLRRSPSAAEAWTWLANSSCERAMLLTTWSEDVEDELERMAIDFKEREAGAAARLQQGLQRLVLLQALTKDHEERHKELEHEELRRRLLRAEAALRERDEANSQKLAALDQQVRHLQGLLVEGEEQILALRQAAAADRSVANSAAQSASETGPVDADLAEQTQQANSSASPASKHQKSAKKKKTCQAQCAGDISLTREDEVIEAIRSDRMVGADPSKLPESFRSCVAEMRKSLASAVDRLARDLYGSEAHFLQELLQNADDNKYSAGVVPSIEFVLRRHSRDQLRQGSQDYFYAVNNELGLTEPDVRALCDISRSSKSLAKGISTGYKGVGWKSVFCVSDTPHVLSNGWRFKFSASGLGMLTPECLSESEYLSLPSEVREAHRAGNTVFYLPLSATQSISSIEAEMSIIESDVAQLLFLRRLREIHLKGHSDKEASLSVLGDEDLRKSIASTWKPVSTEATCDGGVEALSCQETHFEVFTQGDVTVAFSLLEDPAPQRIFAFLPVRSVGFNFAVHAPFHLTASRTDLHRSVENTQRRNSIAPAFLSACKAKQEVASRALKFLGTEPTEAFWLPVRAAILQGMQNVDCLLTESGFGAPEFCVLRGDIPAMQWLPESLLQEVCGLSFATTSNPHEVLRDLGIRTCDFQELIACISYDECEWLKTMWRNPSRSAFFSDIYAALADFLLMDPDRMQLLQRLEIFPIANEGRGGSGNLTVALFNQVVLAASTSLHSELCDAVPHEYQLPLLRCLSADLALAPHGRKLLDVMGVGQVTEAELERNALRQVLNPRSDEQDARHHSKVIWSALAILRRCFYLGRTPPQPWDEVRNAIMLPSASGQFLAPCLLQPWSFIGVQMKIPKDLRQTIYDFAGIIALSSEVSGLETVAAPNLEIPAGESNATWHFGWEVFLCVLGCKPVDPTGQFGECCLEATLQLGSVLASGDFWQQVSSSPPAKAYLRSAIGRGNATARLQWFRRLPVTLPNGSMVSLEDFFLYEVFHRLAGSHLPYIVGAPQDADAHSLLRRLGIAEEMNQDTLLKCLRFLRAQNVTDVGLAADIYMHLGQTGQAGLGREELLLVPGHGYVRPEVCCWLPFQIPLLQRCSRVQVLFEHYSRFGSVVCETLQGWVVVSPESNSRCLCETFLRLIECAKANAATSYRPHGNPAVPPEEAKASLLTIAQQAVGFLVRNCVQEAEAAGVTLDYTDSGQVVANFFRYNRMIVVPDSLRNNGASKGAGPRLIAVHEAYWTVEPELGNEPCADWALELHYSNCAGVDAQLVREFFVKLLGVKAILGLADVESMPLHMPLYPSDESTSGSDRRDVAEGLRGARILVATSQAASTPSQAQQQSADWLARSAIQRAQALTLPSSGVQQPQQNSQAGLDTVGSNAASSMGQAAGSAMPGPGSASSHRNSPRVWRLAGFIEGIKLFVADGALPPEGHVVPDVAQLRRICKACGLRANQIAFAYDPTGQCVCQDNLFLDLSRAQVAARFTSAAESLVFWVSELAQAVAHQGLTGSSDQHSTAFMRLHSEVMALLLPGAYLAEHQFWLRYQHVSR